jgi:hypothetical protein
MKTNAVSETRVQAVRSLSNWEQSIEESLALFGHRNWFVVADAAYPVQRSPGIQTILSGESLPTVLELLLGRLGDCRHVRPLIHVDRELAFVEEKDAPGVGSYRKWLHGTLEGQTVSTAPHDELISRLDRDAQLFSVLVVKTTITIPYTSIFVELDCGYWDEALEDRLRAAMQASSRREDASSQDRPGKTGLGSV